MAHAIPPPHPNPHRPVTFVLPALACDAHCHIFGPHERFPFDPARAYTPPDAPLEDFKRLQATLGLSRAVFVQASCHGTDNRAMVDALVRGAGRYAGVAMLRPDAHEAEIAGLHEVGVRGTRFNFVAHLGGAPDLDEFRSTIDKIRPYGWHVVLHFDAKDLTHYEGLLNDLPIPFVIDHMGRVDSSLGTDQEPFQTLLKWMKNEKMWIKISRAERLTAGGLPPYDDVVPFAKALIAAGPDRVLWGTDWPHPNVRAMPDDGDLIDLLSLVAPDEATRNRILVDNPERLYEFA